MADTDEALVAALDNLIDRADRAGWVEPERVVELLGFTGGDEMPDGAWVRARLTERLRPDAKTVAPVDTVPRSRELRSQIYRWLGMFTAQSTGAEHDHGTLRHLSNKLAEMIEQIPMPIEDKLGEILRGAGIEYPLGLRGVRDLVNQRDGHLEAAREADQLRGQALEERDQALKANAKQAGMIHERDAKLRAAHERAEEAEQRLANAREMVHRLRNAEPVGSASAGYCLVRIEDMLNGQELT